MSEPSSTAQPRSRDLIEWGSGLLAKVSLVALVIVVGAELVMRNLLTYSWEGTDEISSYLVVAVTFFSLATCQSFGGYHELEMVKSRLSPRARGILTIVLHLVCILCALILVWQFSRLVMSSWRSGETSTTQLRIPLWVPQLSMPLGMAAFTVALVRSTLREWRAVRRNETPNGGSIGR